MNSKRMPSREWRKTKDAKSIARIICAFVRLRGTSAQWIYLQMLLRWDLVGSRSLLELVRVGRQTTIICCF